MWHGVQGWPHDLASNIVSLPRAAPRRAGDAGTGLAVEAAAGAALTLTSVKAHTASRLSMDILSQTDVLLCQGNRKLWLKTRDG